MPLRQRNSSKNVTLDQARSWIAFDSFDGPSLIPEEIAGLAFGYVDNVEAVEIEQYERAQSLQVADEDLFAALRDGDIQALGRFSNQPAHIQQTMDWKQRVYGAHSEKRTKIPAEFWWREGVDWNANCARTPSGEFADIILTREDVLALWPADGAEEGDGPTRSEAEPAKEPGKKRGPKERYSEREFLALCVCEAAANDLPEAQAKMVAQMDVLLSVVWGEGTTPGTTWLKQKISYIYEHREKYEHGRQQLERDSL